MPKILTNEDVDDFRHELCEIAAKQFLELGYAGVTMRGLAAEIGCSRMTPYRYFENKEEILAAVRAAAFKKLNDAIEHAGDDISDPVKRLQAFGDTYLQFAVREPNAYRMMFEFSQADQTEYPWLSEQLKRLKKPMRESAKAAVAAGIVDKDPDLVMHLFWAGMHGVITMHLTQQIKLRPSYKKLSQEMIKTLFKGLIS